MREKTVYALGFFDGVHLGHGALLKACRELADDIGCAAGVVTFEGHPEGLVLGKAPLLINTAADREKLLKDIYHMDTVVSLRFDRALMEMPWRDSRCRSAVRPIPWNGSVADAISESRSRSSEGTAVWTGDMA